MRATDKLLIAGIFLLTFALYCTTDIYVAFAPSLIHQFQTEGRLLKFTFVIGPLIAILLSHPIGLVFKHFSYRFLYLITVSVFCLGCWLSGHSLLFSTFIFGRIIQAFSLTALGIINSSLLATLLEGQKENLGLVFQYYSGVFALIFLVSPLLGSVIHSQLSFGWCFYLPILMSLLSVGIIYFMLPNNFSNTLSSNPWPSLRHSKISLIDKDLFLASFPPSVSFVFSVQAPFFLAQLNHLSSHSIGIVQILPLLCQLLASSLKRSFGIWPLLAGIVLLIYSGMSPHFFKPCFVILAFCLFPFYFVPLMANATARYFQKKSKWEASAHLNFSRNLFISVSLILSNFYF